MKYVFEELHKEHGTQNIRYTRRLKMNKIQRAGTLRDLSNELASTHKRLSPLDFGQLQMSSHKHFVQNPLVLSRSITYNRNEAARVHPRSYFYL